MKIKNFLLFTAMTLFSLSTMAKTQNIAIDGDHGKLAAVIQTPDDKADYPMVIICHGFTAHKNRPLLKALADKLEKRGIASIRFDFNGHGDSEGKFVDMTVVNEISDAKKVYEYVKTLPQVTSISIAGHSQGGVVSSMVAGELGENRIKSVVLMAPAAVLRDDAIRGQIFNKHYDSVNPPENVPLDLKDHQDYKLGSSYIKTAQTLPIYETARKYSGPVCLVHGKHDIVVPYTYSIRYQENYKNAELNLIETADHSFTKHVEEASEIAAEFFRKELIK
ncbi:MAG: alpha/beta fold hydrolase [Succinivibrio sp.]|nr:alpha/beta fold hydrolase [Succinivibrio sp.]